jgi:heme exporter protein D
MFGSMGFPEIGVLLYAVVWIAVVVYVFSLAKRFVHAVERIATALEHREDDRPRVAG